MPIGINELNDDDLLEDEVELDDSSETSSYDDDDDLGNLNDDYNSSSSLDDDSSEGGDDSITAFLKDNGIEDPSRIKFIDDEGQMQEKSWNDLTGDEQLNILRSNKREPEEGLDDNEIAFINQLRANGLTPLEYLQLVLEDFNTLLALALQASTPEPTFTSDLLTDDELFVLDMQSKIPDATDEEIVEALTKAKENEDFYQKQVNGIRSEYQRLEQESNDRETALQEALALEEYQLYSNVVLNEIANLQNIGDLDINMDSDDMDELADFILSSDNAGVNYFSKALLDPLTLVQMAWFALHGEEIFNGISDYYNKEILRASRAGYQNGLYAAYNQAQNTPASLVEVRHREPSLPRNNNIAKSISDLDDDL